MSEEAHGDGYYIKTWGLLVVLLVASVVGPMLEIQALTLITAFGIAVVKAYIVATRFMHLNLAPTFVTYIVVTCLVFMLLFFAGVAPDVMNPDGDNWIKPEEMWQYESHHSSAGHGGGH